MPINYFAARVAEDLAKRSTQESETPTTDPGVGEKCDEPTTDLVQATRYLRDLGMISTETWLAELRSRPATR